MDGVKQEYAVVWSGRYGPEPHSFTVRDGDESSRITAPARIGVEGLAEARWLANYLSNYWPGEDYCYVVEGDDES